MNHFNNALSCRYPLLFGRARVMRAQPTLTAHKLWRAIRGGQLGVQFRRQVIVGKHIADFAACSARLIVEVDGGYHSRQSAADRRRDRALGRHGWRVLHLPAELVHGNLPQAVAVIQHALGAPLHGGASALPGR